MRLLSRLAFIDTVRQVPLNNNRHYTLLYTEINHTLQIASLLQGTSAEEELLAKIQALILGQVEKLPGACLGKLDKNRFGILLRLPVKEGLEFADALAGLIDRQRISVGELPYYPKLIIGVTELSPEYKTPERILAAVDEALYQARRAGNSVVKLIEHDDPFLHEYYDALRMLPELREGLSNLSFVLYAQPIVPLFKSDDPKKGRGVAAL